MRDGAALLVAILCAAHDAAGQSPAAPDSAGGYTAEQALRGAATFRQVCAACHVVTQFSGEPFRRAWAGRPARELYEIIRTTMPQDNPGRLRRAQYADVVAYFLSLGGTRPGDVDLLPDSAVLSRVTFPLVPEPRHR